MIQIYVESENGHNTLEVNNPEELKKETEKQLKDDKWVTLEKKDGSTEILTEKDIPKEEPKQSEKKVEAKEEVKSDDGLGDLDLGSSDWQNTFKKDKGFATPSVSSSQKVKSWNRKFDQVRSATANFKAKGG